MHELGIVFNIVNSVEDVAKQNNVARVNSVTLQIGEVSTVVPDYLIDCWNWAVKKSDVLRGAQMVVENIPAVTICNDCGKTYPTVRYGKICPFCKSENTVLQSGNEISIKEIEVVDSAENE